MARGVKFTWVISGLLFAWFFFGHANDLPARFVSHWDFSNNPNGWSTKGSFILGLSSLFIILNGTVAIIYFALHKVPEKALNLPNKDWWFSTPERKALALSRLQTIMASTGLFANLVLFFAAYVIFQNASIELPIRVPMPEGVLFILFLTIGFIGFIFRTTLRFKPKAGGH